MLHENIKRLRLARGLSQEEVAGKLHVVRQTVSKWETGLSVPDAEALLRLAEILSVPVSQLLGLEEESAAVDLAEELARVNQLLAEKTREEARLRRAGEKRGLLLFFAFMALVAALVIEHQVVAAVAVVGCALAALAVLYRNLPLLTDVPADDRRLGTLRLTTLVNGALLLLVAGVGLLTALDVLTFSEQGEEVFALCIIVFVMIFAGAVAPKLPFSRHTGLRLPWTVRDEETWNVAHRVLGLVSLPVAALYTAGVLANIPFETATVCAMVAWIGIPAAVSGVFFWRKWGRK